MKNTKLTRKEANQMMEDAILLSEKRWTERYNIGDYLQYREMFFSSWKPGLI